MESGRLIGAGRPTEVKEFSRRTLIGTFISGRLTMGSNVVGI